MTNYVIIMAVALIGGILIGFVLGVDEVTKKAADGTCVRMNGEAYLRISEEGQKKLMDPSTKVLHIHVIDVATRNKHTL